MPNAIIMMGLPLAGKTTWIESQNLENYIVISADDIKKNHSDYDPDNTELLHEYSVKEAEKAVNEYAVRKYDLIMDGGSINNSYTIRIIDNLKSKGYSVHLVHIKTPYWVCLERNKKRTRKVPDYTITDKAVIEEKQFYKLQYIVDKVAIVDYFTNQNIFVDMDGAIAAQSTLPTINGCIDFVNSEVFKHQKPVYPVIDKLFNLIDHFNKNIYILSATPNSISIDEKHLWLNKYFNIPYKNRYFVNQGKHKAEMLDNLRRKFKLQHKDILMIDDTHSILHDIKARGMNSMHISEFLTHTF